LTGESTVPKIKQVEAADSVNILFMNSARGWGGTEKWTKMAAEAVAERHKTSLVYRREVVGERFSIPKFRLPCVSHLDLYTLLRLVIIIRREKISVMIPTKRKDYMVAGLAGKLTGTPVILRLGADRRLRWPWQRFMYHTLSDGIIVNAGKIKETLLDTGYIPDEKIRVIYNGLNTGEIDRRTSTLHNKPFPFTVSALGRITKNKGFDFLIRAFSRFVELTGNSDAGLVIMGEGDDRKEFLDLAEKLGLGNRILFTGFLENPFPMLSASDVFAMTSTNEGLPNALLEAMYLGNAPISTRAGGSAEAIREGISGFLVDYGDEETLARRIAELYRNPEQRTLMARHAHDAVMQQFSMQRMRDEVIRFCEETIERRHG
jgi:glycosyltransferase involved in cell wall biosynthesis